MGGSGESSLLHHEDWSIGVEAVGLLLLLSNRRELHVAEQGDLAPWRHVVAV